MNLKLLNAITIDLIKSENFIPIRDESDNFILPNDVRTLERREVSDYYIVDLIDGDQMSNGDIIYHFNDNINMRIGSEVTDLVQIYMFTRPITTAIEKLTENNRVLAEDNGINYSSIVVDMNNKQYSTDTAEPDSVFFLEMLISKRLKESLYEFESLPPIDDLIDQDEKYPTLEEVTDKTPATYIIMGINIALFLAGYIIMLITGESLIDGTNLLHKYGIKSASLILKGEYWRFFTPIFLHLDYKHILLNSISLLIFGQAIEKLFGTRKFIIIYLIGGICGNIASFALSDSNSLGASGAIMGLGGSLIYVWISNRTAMSTTGRRYLSLVFMAVISILSGFKMQGIDNLAHLGGFIGGFLISGVLWNQNRGNIIRKTILFTVLIILSIVGILSRF